MRVSSAEFIRNGKDRLVVLSAAEYQKLLARSRRVVLPNELSELDIEVIAASMVPDSYAHLDAEISNQ